MQMQTGHPFTRLRFVLACPITEAWPWPTSGETSPHGQKMDRSISKVGEGPMRVRLSTVNGPVSVR